MHVLAPPRGDVGKDWKKMEEAEAKGEDVAESWAMEKARWKSARTRLDTFVHVPGNWPGWTDVRGFQRAAVQVGLHLRGDGGPHQVGGGYHGV